MIPTIANEYIKKIEVFAPDKSSDKWVQKLKIYFNFVDDVEIPVISEPVVAKSISRRRKRGCREIDSPKQGRCDPYESHRP